MIHIWAVIAIGAGFSTVSIIEGPLKVSLVWHRYGGWTAQRVGPIPQWGYYFF